MILIYTTNKNKGEAQVVAKHLLEKKLIACANIFPVESFYLWKGKTENSDEVASILKTAENKWSAVKKEIEKVHSYDTPCIIKLPAEASEKYDNWINSEIQ